MSSVRTCPSMRKRPVMIHAAQRALGSGSAAACRGNTTAPRAMRSAPSSVSCTAGCSENRLSTGSSKLLHRAVLHRLLDLIKAAALVERIRARAGAHQTVHDGERPERLAQSR